MRTPTARALAWPAVLVVVILVGASLLAHQRWGRSDLGQQPAAAAVQQQERDAAAAASNDIIRERFTDPDDASAFLDRHGGGSCDWISHSTILCECAAQQQ